MKKLITISKNTKTSLFRKITGSIFHTEITDNVSGRQAADLLIKESPDYVILNNIKPVNGMDMMSVLRHIDGNIRLRVAIFYLGFFKKKHNPVLSTAKSRS